jgi:hypothetical protein
MTLALIGIGIGTALELLLWVRLFWPLRKVVASISSPLLIVGSIAVVRGHPSFWTALLLVLSGYRVINMLRIVKGRTVADYLFRVARGTTLWLIATQAVIFGAAWFAGHYKIDAVVWWFALAGVQLGLSFVLMYCTVRNIDRTQPPELTAGYADKDLPSITVAIPARNETADLTACLESLIASTYPKLEILVLDDCSQNKRTPEIIRGFAHEGVRFIAGQNPPPNWLAKNFAYEQLFNQSNGALLLFCGVDARFTPESLTVIVKTMLQKQKTMMSIIPQNTAPKSLSLESLLVQPTRYAWELSLPRRWLNRPPVLSTCWIISRELLSKNGTFKAVTRSIAPEAHFAKAAREQHDGYSFVQSSQHLGVTCLKQFDEQQATAVRTRYPQLHRRPEIACLLGLALLLEIVAPYVICIAALLVHQWALATLSGVTVLILTYFYVAVVSLTYRRTLVRSLWLLPFAGLYDIALLNYSMYRYEFSDVVWKGRNVCVPVMRTIDHLPKI